MKGHGATAALAVSLLCVVQMPIARVEGQRQFCRRPPIPDTSITVTNGVEFAVSARLPSPHVYYGLKFNFLSSTAMR